MPSGMPTTGDDLAVPLDIAEPISSLDLDSGDSALATAMVFRSLGHPLRLKILAHLYMHGPTHRSELTAQLHLPWSVMEHHLTALTRDGFIEVHGTGRSSTYVIADGLFGRLQALCAASHVHQECHHT